MLVLFQARTVLTQYAGTTGGTSNLLEYIIRTIEPHGTIKGPGMPISSITAIKIHLTGGQCLFSINDSCQLSKCVIQQKKLNHTILLTQVCVD